jgi:asparagine synthase (glutamine-hydrolysing)
MKGFLAVSFGTDAPASVRRPLNAAVSCLASGDALVEQAWEDGWIAFSADGCTDNGGDQLGGPDGAFTVSLGHLLRDAAGDRSPSEVATMIASADRALTRLLPPFAVVQRQGPHRPVLAAVDWLGFYQLYVWQGPGVAAISTSARALALLAGSELDVESVGVQAMIGWQLGDATVFQGVRSMPAASVATLAGGMVRVGEYAERMSFASSEVEPPSLAHAIEEMSEILRTSLGNYIAAYPDAVLQLTGGHDSRILLGAIAESRRRGLRALTAGDEGSRDVAIAADLCQRYGMVHDVHRVDEQTWPLPRAVHELVMDSSRALECMASPIALAPLLLAEAAIDQGHRLSGLGGEVARGFYYSGQPREAQTSTALIRRLAQWRLCINEAVESAALDPDFLERARSGTLRALDDLFPRGDWLRATDEFYLYQRMRRWGGTHGTVATLHRQSVNFMFDRRFIELALAVAPVDKRNSLLLGRLMSRLDRELAGIPLDIGLVPCRLGEKTMRTRLAIARSAGRRTAGKAWQRFTGGRRPQVGAATAAGMLLQHWRADPRVCEPLFEIDFLRGDWLRDVLAGARDVKPTTLAFLANVLAAVTPRGITDAT